MDNENFVQKKIEQPVMGAELGRQMGQAASFSAEESFYQTNKVYIWAVAFGILVIALLAFFAFRKPKAVQPAEAKADLQISAPANISSGGEAVYTIKLQNNDSQKLAQVRLEIAYPEGVSYVSSVPKAENLSGTVFNVPDLVSGQISPAIIIKTRVSGNVGDTKQLVARMFYRFSNFNSEFVKEKAYAFELKPSDVQLEFTGPQSVSNAQLVMYVVKYKNNSDRDILNTRIRINLPEGFSMAQADPPASLGSNIWEIGNLSAGQSGQIQLQGNFKSSNPGESKNLNAEFMVFLNGEYNVQSTSQIATEISSLPLLVSQEVSGSSSDSVASPGDTLNYEISYSNNSTVAANGVNVVVALNSKALDFSSVQAEGGEVNNNTIIWTAAGVPNLEILNPSESGTLRFSVRIKDPAVKDSSANLTVVSDIKIKSNEFQNYFPGNSLTIKVASPAALSSKIIYVSGQQPPKVGQATTYRVTFRLSNSTNDYSDGLLTAFIPLGSVVFDSQSVAPLESSRVEFDPATGKLTWKVGILQANAGKFSAARTLDFNVKVTPSQSQAGQNPTLIKNITFTSKDAFTLQNIELTGQNITTNDLEGGGTVIGN